MLNLGVCKILSDNGTEFKNQLFTDVAMQLGVEHKIYSPLIIHNQMEELEEFHNFPKACMSKHVSKSLEWYQVVPLACAACNFLSNEH